MKLKNIVPLFFFSTLCICVEAQTIPYGLSLDSIEVYDGYYHKGPIYQSFHLYKPSTYNNQSSILFIMHGQGGNGATSIGFIDSIAERRSALIIAPNFAFSGFSVSMREQSAQYTTLDSLSGYCNTLKPVTPTIRDIYNHILIRENKASVDVRMIGFSAGGQFVSRYMLWRQLYPDSIPIVNAVSSSGYYYTFPTDTLTGVPMPWLCGILKPDSVVGYCDNYRNIYNFCNEHIVQYYNENYHVIVGQTDFALLNDNACAMAQGVTRWQRAYNFYNFCDSNAVKRGTTLQWQYQEVPNVAHDEYAIYNTKASPTDSSTIAETLLFDTPYHAVPFTAPVVAFYADTTKIYVNGTVNFFNTSINATSYLWDFGDGSTSTLANPSHTYTVVDTFIVQLTAYNSTGCSNWTERRHYIKVINPVGVNSINYKDYNITINPNITSDIFSIKINSNVRNFQLILFDATGNVLLTKDIRGNNNIDISWLSKGFYFYQISNLNDVIGRGKIVKQ